ncbi:MBL fold metallo-hydrolase [Ponticaulis profundi]|uniref:MBL fold metallo-hydrolase n=2 Tax=Ponticaulis profundi TaxID=2665222 RepID=A0ABW1SEA0_9PROT
MSNNRVIILGCGSSGGVPRIGNEWGACDPLNGKNRRSRCGIYLEMNRDSDQPIHMLIDTAPELREQLIRSEISLVDCVLYTHTHADQCHGIDDLRVLAYLQRAQMPIYGSKRTMEELCDRFSYCFQRPSGSPYPPILDAKPHIHPYKLFEAKGLRGGAVSVLPLDQDHGSMRSLGFRMNNIAYCNDVVELPEQSLAQLEGLDLFIVDTLRYEPHPTHAHLERVLSWIERIQPKRAVLTNLHIDLDYDRLRSELPAHVEPAYDAMVLDV